MRVRFLGSGDAFGSGARFNTCIHLSWSEGQALIDCGASSMIAIRKFGVDPNAIRAILVTHLHGDHFGGLPFFLLDAQLVSRRTAPLLLAGPPGFGERLAAAMEVLFPGSSTSPRKYALELREIGPGSTHGIAGLEVTPYLLQHWSGAPPLAYRIEADGKVVTYSGDTEWVPSLIDAARGADLFICEAYFFEKSIKWHLDWKTLQAHRPQIAAKRIVLTHMSADMLARLDEVDCETAADGQSIDLD